MRYTLWQLLCERRIEIPVFQRDYAQGRADKATLRRDVIHQLVRSLKGGKDSDGSLDFVYSFGNTSEEAAPLDGQQRLTTLWLLHWYLAIKVLTKDKLQESLEILSKFTYRTRHSSSDFISSLCRVNNVADLNKADDITDSICDSTWFVKSWLQDPTVMGMLTTLKGTEVSNISSPNGIHPILKKYSHQEICSFWNLLISDNCPIIFDHLNIERIEVKSPDLLYVKMNARGKSLSAYEKFKAQWIKSIKKINKEDAFEISRLIDNEWSDIFWDKQLKVKGIDQRKMAFFTRFYLYCLMLSFVTDDSLKDLALEKKEKILGASPLYAKETIQDWYNFDFTGMEEFEIPSFDSLEHNSLVSKASNNELELIFTNLNPLKNTIKDLFPKYITGFSFIPYLRTKKDGSNETDSDGNWQVENLSMKQQALFFAVCLYLVKSESQTKPGLHRWLRVCSNFIENTNPKSERQTQLNVIKWIYQLGTCVCVLSGNGVSEKQTIGCDSILECLKNFEFNKSNEIENVLWEEQEKAIRILSNENTEREIEEAETFAFFNGAIRFLFLNENGDVDWNSFAKKLSTAKNLFCHGGLTDSAGKDDITNRQLISYCDDWCRQIEDRYYILSHKADTWRKILLDVAFCGPVHKLLMTNSFANNPHLKESDKWRALSHRRLVDGKYLKYYNRERVNLYYVRWMGGALPDNGMCLYLKGRPGESFFLASTWTFELSNIPEFKINEPSEYLYSRRSDFDIEYKGYDFRFQTWGWVDMYVDGKKLEEIDALKGKCVFQTPWIDPQNPGDGIELLKLKFEECIVNYEHWKFPESNQIHQ